jgi:general secretion pathway protein E
MPVYEIHDENKSRCVRTDSHRITIGRISDNQIVIGDKMASRIHCEVRREGESYILRDLQSRNGTVYNQYPVNEPVELREGDEIGIGDAAIRFWISSRKMSRESRKLPLLDIDGVRGEKPEHPSRRAHKHSRSSDSHVGRGGTGKHANMSAAQIIEQGEAELFQSSDSGHLILSDSMIAVGLTLNNILPLNTDGTPAHEKGEDASQISVAMLRLKQILLRAFQFTSTDIHIEPREDAVRLRYRIDGTLHHSGLMDHRIAKSVLSIVKLLCNLDISKQQVMQDGAFAIQLPDRRVEMRVSLAPVTHGDKMVVRILDKNMAPQGLDGLGMEPIIYDQVHKLARRESSMMVMCGPTGSGKTTTIYAVMQEMNREDKNIVTVEDPVEYRLDNVTQIQINPKRDITFTSALKSLLRQDPDVILIGEIRDEDTAQMAVQSAMTGHLVLTTLHARDSLGSIFRLLDLGVESFLLGSALTAVLSQRLLRKLCPKCKTPVRPSARVLSELGVNDLANEKLFNPVGCSNCLGIGYRGRIPIFEILTMTDQVREAISYKPTMQQLRLAAGDWIFQTLQDDAIRKIRHGISSLEEFSAIAVNEGDR